MLAHALAYVRQPTIYMKLEVPVRSATTHENAAWDHANDMESGTNRRFQDLNHRCPCFTMYPTLRTRPYLGFTGCGGSCDGPRFACLPFPRGASLGLGGRAKPLPRSPNMSLASTRSRAHAARSTSAHGMTSASTPNTPVRVSVVLRGHMHGKQHAPGWMTVGVAGLPLGGTTSHSYGNGRAPS